MKQKFIILAVSLFSLASSQAAITLFAEYKLGETGSLLGTNKLPQDSSGNARHVTDHVNGNVALVGSTLVIAPGSTEYIDTSMAGNQGWFANGLLTSLPVNDFAFGIYARATSTDVANRGNIVTTGNLVSNTFKVGLDSGGWSASSHNVGFMGSSAGTSFAANTWAHLAVIRSSGIATFYIDGIAQAGTVSVAPNLNNMHLGLNPGNTGDTFDGNLDNFRIVSFTSGESTSNVLNALTIPEPSAALLGSLAILTLLRRRRA